MTTQPYRARLAALVFLALPLGLATAASAQTTAPGCYPIAVPNLCTATPGSCRPGPTSLYPLSATTTESEGFNRGTKCGKDANGNFCGAYLGDKLCGLSSPGHACECGPGVGACAIGPEDGGLIPALTLAPNASPADVTERLIAAQFRKIAKTDLPAELAGFWRALSDVPAITLHARVEVWVNKSTLGGPNDPGIFGSGTFEYWGSDRQYHAKAQLPPSLGLTRFEEAASDGRESRFFISDDGLLSIHGADHRFWYLPIRNPLFMPLLFLDPADDASEPLPELRLFDLRAARPRASQRKVTPGGETIEVPRRQVWGQELAQVRVATWQGARGPEMSLEQQDSKGTRLARVEMKNWNAVSGAPGLSFPWTLIYTRYDSTGTWPQVRTTYLIEEIQASPDLPEETFRLNPTGVLSIWDEVERKFIF